MKDKLALLKDYKLHIVAILATIAAELIGSKTLNIAGISIVLSPLIWAMILVFIIYKLPLNLVTEKNASNANVMMGAIVALLIAKLGVTSGGQIEEIKKAGVALVLQNFGNLGTILMSLPIALVLGLGRESVGMTFALSREACVGLVQDTYGAQSAEFRGVMAVFIIGTIFGPIIMSVLCSVFVGLGLVSPLAAAMGSGAGSASMMTAGLGSLIASHPELTEQMTAYAGLSNLISSVIALPLSAFIGLPLTNSLYEAIKGKKEAQNG